MPLSHKTQFHEACGPYASVMGCGEGVEFDLLQAGDDARAFHLEAIARSLSRQVRWLGRGKQLPLSVLTHSLCVGEVVDKIIRRQNSMPYVPVAPAQHYSTVLWAYLHDVHEAFMGDVQRPVARALAYLAGQDVVAKLRQRIDRRVREHFRVDGDLVLPLVVDQADDLVCAWESKQLGMTHVRWSSSEADVELERLGIDPTVWMLPDGLGGVTIDLFCRRVREYQELLETEGASA